MKDSIRMLRFFDKLEDRVRGTLSRSPIIYGIIGGVAVVMFWRGIWHSADLIEKGESVFAPLFTASTSTIISAVVLLATGLFVSFFIGDRIILSGLKHEKKIEEKTEEEVREEGVILLDLFQKLERIEREVHGIKEELKKK